MQPTIICTAPEAGIIYLNGRFAGEASRERPLCAPVVPSGALYVEYRPLAGCSDGMARRLVLSGGVPLAGPLADCAGLDCVCWPDGAVEIELTPVSRSSERFPLEGTDCELSMGGGTTLSLNGLDIPLPDGAGRPRLIRFRSAAALVGDIDGGGRYLASLSPDLSAHTGTLFADAIELSEDGTITAVASRGDSVGHGSLEQWVLDGSGLSRVSTEAVWSHGAPRWPRTAGETMIAAVEAVLAGLPDEAEGYLSPALARDRPLDAVDEICDLCLPMKYALPDSRPCVGLMKAVNDHLATVRPLYYRAEPVGGRQSSWQIEGISLE